MGKREFKPLNISVLTVSDTRTENDDKSGCLLVKRLSEEGHRVGEKKICPDNQYEIRAIVSRWISDENVNAILTTGGTGVTGRDGTPEAIIPLLDKVLNGFGEMFRFLSYEDIGTSTLQSRACAILKNGKYIFALPGSSGGVKDAWDMILKNQLNINHKPCNFVELFPRLKEK